MNDDTVPDDLDDVASAGDDRAEGDPQHAYAIEPHQRDPDQDADFDTQEAYLFRHDLGADDNGEPDESDDYYVSSEVDLLVEEAMRLVELGRAAEAAPVLLQALSIQPYGVQVQDQLIRVYDTLGDYTAALDITVQAIAHQPGYYLWHYWRSKLLHELGDDSGALTAAEAAAQAAPYEQYSLYNLAYMQQICGREAEAEATARRLLERKPHWDGSYYVLAWVCMEQERWQEAEEYYRKDLELNPDFAIAQHYRGYCCERLGRRREAIEMYYCATVNGPTSDWLRQRLVETTEAEGFDSPEEYARRRNDPAVWSYVARRRSLLWRARESLDRNDPGEAIRILNAALPAYTRDVLFLDQLAAAHWAAKALSSALHYAAMEVIEAPDDWRGHLRRGQILVALSDEASGDAATRLRKDGIASAFHAAQLAPDNRWTLSRLVSLEHACNMLSEAEQTAQRLLQIAPDWSDSHYYVGIVYHARGLLRLAESYYRKALELDPNEAGVFSELGRALWDQKRFQEAIDCFRRTVEIEPDNPYYEHNYKLAQARMKGSLAVNFYMLSRIKDYKLFTEL